MIFLWLLMFTLLILIVGYAIPPEYYLGMYHDEFQHRNAKNITFSTEKPTGVGDSLVGIYDWTNGNSGEI